MCTITQSLIWDSALLCAHSPTNRKGCLQIGRDTRQEEGDSESTEAQSTVG